MCLFYYHYHYKYRHHLHHFYFYYLFYLSCLKQYNALFSCNINFFSFCSKFIYVNYRDTFDFTKKESAYIAGSVYLMSMVFGPLMGLFVVRCV